MNPTLILRAKRLAQPLGDKSPKDGKLQLLCFRLGEEVWAIELRWIDEVYPVHALTPLPHSPAHLFGLMNVRRKVLPLFNLKALFGMPEHKLAQENKAIILSSSTSRLAILADAIDEIQSCYKQNVLPFASLSDPKRQELLLGISDKGIIVANGQQLLSTPLLQLSNQ